MILFIRSLVQAGACYYQRTAFYLVRKFVLSEVDAEFRLS